LGKKGVGKEEIAKKGEGEKREETGKMIKINELLDAQSKRLIQVWGIKIVRGGKRKGPT